MLLARFVPLSTLGFKRLYTSTHRLLVLGLGLGLGVVFIWATYSGRVQCSDRFGGKMEAFLKGTSSRAAKPKAPPLESRAEKTRHTPWVEK